jgi:hypothetical protein
LKGQGFAGVSHKVTQGSGFQDWAWPVALQWCLANFLPIIGYHYLDLSDPADQANNYVTYNGTKNVMFDWEGDPGDPDNFGGGLANFWACVQAFNNRGVNVQLGYCPRWYLEGVGSGDGTDISNFAANGILLVSSGYPDGYNQDLASNIYARGGGDNGEGWAAYDGATPAAWQFTSVAQVSGHVVDCNAYLGDNITSLFGVES